MNQPSGERDDSSRQGNVSLRDAFSYPPLGMSREVAARYIGIGATKFDQLVKDGRMPRPKRIDGRKIWIRTQLESAVFELPDDADGRNSIDEQPRRFASV